MDSPEKHLTANLTPSQDVTLLGVNEKLHVLAQQLKNKRPEDVAEALRLVNQYADMVIEPVKDFEYFKQFEMDLPVRSWVNPYLLTDLGDGLAFREDNGDKYNVVCVKKMDDKLEHCYEVRNAQEVSSIVNINNIPAVEAIVNGLSCVYFAGEVADKQLKYESSRSPMNSNGQLAYVALTKEKKLVIVVNGIEKPIPEEIEVVEYAICINNRFLICGFAKNCNGYVYYYDNKKIEIDNKFVTVKNFFVFNGVLGYVAVKKENRQETIVLDNKELDIKEFFPGKDLGVLEIIKVEEVLGKMAITIETQIGGKYVIYDNKLLTGWSDADEKFPCEYSRLVSPVVVEDIFVLALRPHLHSVNLLWNNNNQFIELTEFDEVHQIVPLQGKICAILGKREDKFIRRVFDLSEGWQR